MEEIIKSFGRSRLKILHKIIILFQLLTSKIFRHTIVCPPACLIFLGILLENNSPIHLIHTMYKWLWFSETLPITETPQPSMCQPIGCTRRMKGIEILSTKDTFLLTGLVKYMHDALSQKCTRDLLPVYPRYKERYAGKYLCLGTGCNVSFS